MLDELGIAHIGDAGVAVAVLITVIIVTWSARGIALAWLESTRERNTREHERELQRLRDRHDQEMAEAAANQAIAEALQSLKKRMEADANRQDLIEATTRSLIASAKQLSELIETTTHRMAERAQQMDHKLAAIHSDVKTVPAEVWRMGDPKLDGVIDVLAGMESRLLAKLQPGADVARAIIRDEFGDLINRIRVIVEYLERDRDESPIAVLADSVDRRQESDQDAQTGGQSGDRAGDQAPGRDQLPDAQSGSQSGDPAGDQNTAGGHNGTAPSSDQNGEK